MNCCSHCEDAADLFSDKKAKKELRHYRRKGPETSTRLLLDTIRKEKVEGKTLLDIGGGVGVIPFELFSDGLERAVNVEASQPFLKVSGEESEKRGHSAKMTYHFGDFTDMAHTLDEADIVTLDKVICCYPDMEKLVRISTGKAGTFYGVIYPRERHFTWIAIGLANLWFRFRGSNFRSYLHPPVEIDRQIRNSGFRLVRSATTFLWQIKTWVRVQQGDDSG